nr:PREDICTED: nischarin-like [Stegastes partitus]
MLLDVSDGGDPESILVCCLSIRLSELLAVNVGLFDQYFRVVGGSAEHVVCCLSRDSYGTSVFLQELMAALSLQQQLPPPEPSDQDFYSQFTSTCTGNRHYTCSGNRHYTCSDNRHYTCSGNRHYTCTGNRHYTCSGNRHYTCTDVLLSWDSSRLQVEENHPSPHLLPGLSPGLKLLAGLGGQQLLNYFHRFIALSESEELKQVLWLSVVLYRSPEAELTCCLLLSTDYIYFLLEDSASTLTHHSGNNTDR